MLFRGVEYITINAEWISKSPLARCIVLAAILYLSAILFKLRRDFLTGYAVLEIALGMGVAWCATNNFARNYLFGLPGIISAVYFLIRGFDNWAKAKEQRTALTSYWASLRAGQNGLKGTEPESVAAQPSDAPYFPHFLNPITWIFFRRAGGS
jgi:hypothetical protein